MEFSFRALFPYISDKQIVDLIQRYDKKLDDFTEIEQIKLATFVLNYQADETDEANEERAQTLVERWKKNYS